MKKKILHIPEYELKIESSTSLRIVATYKSTTINYKRRKDLEM